MYFFMECFVVCVLEVIKERYFVGYFDGRGTYMGVHFISLVVWGTMSDSNIEMIDYIESSPVSCRSEM